MDRERRTFVVDLLNKTCQCCEFHLNQFIYAHGVTTCAKRSYFVYNYISKYYTTETLLRIYVVVVHAISSHNSWAVSADVKSRVVKEPIVRKLHGRPKKKRIEPNGEECKLAITRLAEVHFP